MLGRRLACAPVLAWDVKTYRPRLRLCFPVRCRVAVACCGLLLKSRGTSTRHTVVTCSLSILLLYMSISHASRPTTTGLYYLTRMTTILLWILPSQPPGYNPVGKPSTGCGTLRQSHNANAGITGREAHKSDGSNANATTIYSNTHDDPKAYSHIPSETRRRTCTIPTRWRYHGGTGTQLATVSGPGL